MDLGLGTRLRLGVSSCLLGEDVRYDGQHKLHHWVDVRFGPMVEWVRNCPEAEAGLGVPREAIQLEASARGTEIRGVESGTDHTLTLSSWSDARVEALGLAMLDGYVFKGGSPSCGVEGVPVFLGEHEQRREPGVFAARVLAADPTLPTCTETDTEIPERRRHFLERAQARARWRRLVERLARGSEQRHEDVNAWLATHDLLLRCREQSPLRADGCALDAAGLVALGRELATRLQDEPTVSGHVEALAPVIEHCTDLLDAERDGLCILLRETLELRMDVEVPRQLARGLALRAGDDWLRAQHYFDPVPNTAREDL